MPGSPLYSINKLRKLGMPIQVHQCARDPDCVREDAPNRLYVHTPWGSLIIALDRDSTTQLWLPGRGYTQTWSAVVWHPRDKAKVLSTLKLPRER